MSLRGHGRRWWLGCTVVALLGVGGVLVRAPSLAAGSNTVVAYTGERVHVSAAATVEVRELARIDRLRNALPRLPGSIRNPPPQAKGESEEEAESAELAEPNLGVATPAPLFYARSTSSSAPVEPSPFPAASFLGQADVPQLGTNETESPPDTDGA